MPGRPAALMMTNAHREKRAFMCSGHVVRLSAHFNYWEDESHEIFHSSGLKMYQQWNEWVAASFLSPL